MLCMVYESQKYTSSCNLSDPCCSHDSPLWLRITTIFDSMCGIALVIFTFPSQNLLIVLSSGSYDSLSINSMNYKPYCDSWKWFIRPTENHDHFELPRLRLYIGRKSHESESPCHRPLNVVNCAGKQSESPHAVDTHSHCISSKTNFFWTTGFLSFVNLKGYLWMGNGIEAIR